MRVLAALALVVGLGAGVASAAPTPPAPTRWVTDQVGLLSPGARGELDLRLEAYQRRSGHQIVVWIGDTLGDEPLDDWAVRTFEAWRPGRKGEDDGLALFIFARDQKIAIEVGYGLEDEIPDVTAARIIREVMVPRLQAGDPDGAVRAAIDDILQRLGDDAARSEPAQGQARSTGHDWKEVAIWAVLLVAFLVLLVVNPRLALWLLWAITSGGRGGGGGGGGGGGFSGGGGRSGGGGARGGW